MEPRWALVLAGLSTLALAIQWRRQVDKTGAAEMTTITAAATASSGGAD